MLGAQARVVRAGEAVEVPRTQLRFLREEVEAAAKRATDAARAAVEKAGDARQREKQAPPEAVA